MRIYNPQNQFGQDLITKNQVTLITGLEGLKGDKNIDQRLIALEGTAPSTALHTIDGDDTDALAKISFTIDATDSTKAKASLTTVKAELAGGVISGAGIATGSQVATAIATETTRATGVEDAIKADIGSWSSGSEYTGKAVKEAIESLASITGFKVVSVLPTTGDKNTIYILKPEGKESGPYEEWIYVDGKWEKIGDTDIQIQNYYKKSEVGEGFSESSTVKAYIEAQDAAVKDTVDTADATSSDGHVTVNLTGTVGDHGLTVSTSDIASAAALTALTTRVDTAESDIDAVETKLAGIDGTVKAYVDAVDAKVDAETARAEGVEGDLNTRLTTAEGKIATNTQQIAANTTAIAEETSRATTAENALDGRLDDVEGKLAGLPEDKTIEEAIEEAVSAEETRATGVEGTLTDLTTDATGNLVAAINEVDAHADAAQTAANNAQTAADAAQAAADAAQADATAAQTAAAAAQTAADNAQNAADTAQATAEARLASIAGGSAQGVFVQFSTSDDKAVSTTITVTESTLDDDSKFATTDTAVATGAKVQAAIDAAEARAKEAQTYTADGTTLQLSASNEFSAKTAAVAENGTALTTGGQVWTAVDDAKTVLLGNTSITTTEKTITKAIALAEAAQADVDAEVTTRKADVNAILGGTKHAVGTMLELAVEAKSGVDGTFTITGKPEDVSTLHIVRVEWNHEDYMCKHSGNDVVLWNASDVWPDGATKPQASEIKVFALVTATTSVAG